MDEREAALRSGRMIARLCIINMSNTIRELKEQGMLSSPEVYNDCIDTLENELEIVNEILGR
ncbi:hypothetical protein KAR91_22170 [Candidatus Pacearchaeota archaeon]|nr:hypothetical protein [Candidatus Pacearchaeota archaeon]